jgi:hypothetical protein
VLTKRDRNSRGVHEHLKSERHTPAACDTIFIELSRDCEQAVAVVDRAGLEEQ